MDVVRRVGRWMATAAVVVGVTFGLVSVSDAVGAAPHPVVRT